MESGLSGSAGRFEEYAQDALDSLPSDLRARISNLEIVVEDEPPPGQRLLGLYQGVPLSKRSSHYGGVLPDKITIYRGPLVRLYGHDPDRLRREVRRVVLHEVARAPAARTGERGDVAGTVVASAVDEEGWGRRRRR